MDKLKLLMSKCKCSVTLMINDHRDNYDTAEQALKDDQDRQQLIEVTPDVKQMMIWTDTIISLQFYPDTPIGSYSIYHYDLDACLDQALECFDIEGEGE